MNTLPPDVVANIRAGRTPISDGLIAEAVSREKKSRAQMGLPLGHAFVRDAEATLLAELRHAARDWYKVISGFGLAGHFDLDDMTIMPAFTAYFLSREAAASKALFALREHALWRYRVKEEIKTIRSQTEAAANIEQTREYRTEWQARLDAHVAYIKSLVEMRRKAWREFRLQWKLYSLAVDGLR